MHVVTGTVEFIWEADEGILITLEPDQPGPQHPHTFEVSGAVLERLSGSVSEGDRVEVEFVAVAYEVVDPDSGPSERHRAEVRDLRLLL